MDDDVEGEWMMMWRGSGGYGGGVVDMEGEWCIICDRLWENWAQRGMRRRRKKINLVLKIVLNKPNEGNG